MSNWLKEKSAVSSVVGAVLTVAIVVFLAGVLYPWLSGFFLPMSGKGYAVQMSSWWKTSDYNASASVITVIPTTGIH